MGKKNFLEDSVYSIAGGENDDLPPDRQLEELLYDLDARMQRGCGFSILEASVVLVVLALITGGVIAGRSMVRSSEIQGFVTTQKKYESGIRAFKTQYGALPGDLTNATSYWGTSASCPGTGTTYQSTTCNGDGDGMIEYSTGAGVSSEVIRMWQQLHLAGLIEGRFIGTGTTGSNQAAAGVNVPGNGNRGYWYMYWVGTTVDSNWSFYPGNYRNALMLYFSSWPAHGNLTPGEAKAFDTKIDDGHPNTGNFTPYESDGNSSMPGTNYDCTTYVSTSSPIPDTNDYFIANPEVACNLVFKTNL